MHFLTPFIEPIVLVFTRLSKNIGDADLVIRRKTQDLRGKNWIN